MMEFLLGEEKWVELEVAPVRAGDAVVITSALYRLIGEGGKTEREGAFEVNETRVRALLKPERKGAYILEVSVTVPPETRKERVTVRVS